MVRQAGELALVDQRRRRLPLVVIHVEVKILQRRRRDQIAAPAQDSGGLRPHDGLAATKGDQIRALGDEAAQVLDRRQLRGGIHDDRHAASMGHLGHRGQRRQCIGLGHVEDGGGGFADGVV